MAAHQVVEDTLPPLDEVFDGAVVLLTGATGFLGRMWLEKLLRTCPTVERVYVLLRPKRGRPGARRLDDLLAAPVFDVLRVKDPQFRRKLQVVDGDCAQPALGISERMRAQLALDVSVVVHWAATVRFDEAIRVATHVNVRAVRDLLELAHDMRRLRAFLHVSTAFAHCARDHIAERCYATPITPAALIRLVDTADTPKLSAIIAGWPNTYVFTKAVAEHLVRDAAVRHLPVAIVRPSMVLASYVEPLPGWIDNVYGPTGTMIGMAIGVIRVMRTDLDCTAEVIPGDYVVSAAMAAIIDIHHRQSTTDGVRIYNVVSSAQNAITWRNYRALTRKHCLAIPSPKIVWHSMQLFTGNRALYMIGIVLLHYVPAYVIDACAICVGRKPVMVKMYRKIHHLIETVCYFGMRRWRFEDENVRGLWRRLAPADRTRLNFNVADIDWDDYFATYTRGGRLYILHDTMDTIPAGRRKLRMLRVAHYALCAFLLYVVYRAIAVVLNVLRV